MTLTRNDVAVSRNNVVRIRKSGDEIGSVELMNGWWWTFPRTNRATYQLREDAIAALIERGNAEHAG